MTNATRLPAMFGLVLLGLVLYHSVASAQACPPPIAEERTTREIPSSMIVADSIGVCPGADRASDLFAVYGGFNVLRWDTSEREPIYKEEGCSRLEDDGVIDRSPGNHKNDPLSLSATSDSAGNPWRVLMSDGFGHVVWCDGGTVPIDDHTVLPVVEIDRNHDEPLPIAADSLLADWVAISHNNDTIDYRWDSLTLFAPPIGGHGHSIAEGLTRGGYHAVKLVVTVEVDSTILDRPRRDTTGRFVTIHDVYPQSALLTSFTLPLIVPHGDVADPETIASPDPILIISSGAQTDPVAKDEEHAATSVAIPHAPGLD